MRDIGSILQRIRRVLGKDTEIKNAVAECIKGAAGFNIAEDDIELKDGVLIITSSPAKNSAIRLKEAEILREIKERCGVNIVRILYR